MTSTRYHDVPVDRIDIGKRLRSIDWRWVDYLASMIKSSGLKDPIEVVRTPDDRFRLLCGAHRLKAVRELGHTTIRAQIVERPEKHAEHWFIQREALDNLSRYELTVLDRAIALAALKNAYEVLYPSTRHGGKRRGKASENKKEIQVAKLATRFTAAVADRVGMSERAIQRAVAMANKIGPEIRNRLCFTPFADREAELELLARQKHEYQIRICDLLFAEPPAASSVVDAIAILAGKKPKTAADKAWQTVISRWANLSKKQRFDFFDENRDLIAEWSKRRSRS